MTEDAITGAPVATVETKPAKSASKATETTATADMAAAVATALRQTNAHRFGPPDVAPTERVKAAALAIKQGKSVQSAMAGAGYGRKYIEGNAATFPAFLVSLGLLNESQARKAAGAVLAGGD